MHYQVCHEPESLFVRMNTKLCTEMWSTEICSQYSSSLTTYELLGSLWTWSSQTVHDNGKLLAVYARNELICIRKMCKANKKCDVG